MSSSRYLGDELGLFQHAVTWKAYVARLLAPFLQGDVLEVGAGIGGTTRAFYDGRQHSWTCLEPDPTFVAALQGLAHDGTWPRPPHVTAGTLTDLPVGESYDAILYIDVLEHIEDDRGELERACTRLRPGGTLIVLAPAHPTLYTAFDARIGHFRRYTRASLAAVIPTGLTTVRLRYVDAAGLLASAANRLLLRSARPTAGQVQFWDRGLVPVSRVLDRLTGGLAGKSVLGLWQRPLAG